MYVSSIFLTIFILVFFGGVVAVIRHLSRKQKEEAISDILIAGGFELIIASFGTFDDKLFAFLSGTQANINYVQLGIGLLLLMGGIFFFFYVKNKLYILNINGYYDKRVEQHHQDLGLNAFQFKERDIDFIRTFRKGMSAETAEDIQEEFKNKIPAFISESQDKSRAYTGIAPIPFIFVAGKMFARERIDKYFEYNKFEQTYYELATNKKRRKPYESLRPVTALSSIPSSSTVDVVLAISITQHIPNADLTQFPYPIVHLAIPNPADNAIKYTNQLKEYTSAIYDMLIAIGNHYPKVKRIHLAYAGQSCLAFEVGKLLDDQRIKEIISYWYDTQNTIRYPWGIVINGQRKGTYIEA
ncbi:SAVED domain-containing protein [Falsibacillus pallidus]|uniref:SAVED domain-containing protein n=1 Tax=Falsibacillus pallidus TaxID=493781 RepID=UPI003D961A39